MENEKLQETQNEGERYLDLLGLGDFGNRMVKTSRGIKPARDFLEFPDCADHARPLLQAFEAMSPQDPRYEDARNALRTAVISMVENLDPSQ